MTMILIGALLIGLTVGLLGSGGSVISVPILVYVVGHGGKEAITESMAIVGLIAFFATIPYAKARLIDWWSFWNFGIPGVLGTLIGAWLGGLVTEAFQLSVFGSVLLLAAMLMVLESKRTPPNVEQDNFRLHRSPFWKIGSEGLIVGVVTGFVGVGGGFLIVPSLVVLGKLPMRLAIGTSLAIIVIKAATGFAKYQHYLLSEGLSVDQNTIMIFTIVGIIGSLIGSWLNTKLNQRMLKQIFAGFLILLGGLVMFYEGGKLLDS